MGAMATKSWGIGRFDLPLSQCPVQHPDLFGMESRPQCPGPFEMGQTEWYRTEEAAKQRLQSVPQKAVWNPVDQIVQIRSEPARLSTNTNLWKVILLYSPGYWL